MLNRSEPGPCRRPRPPSSHRRAALPRRLELLARGYAALTETEPIRSRSAPWQRRWRRLAETPEYDAWLIAWSASSGIDLHDHGDSTGVIHVLRGVLVERYRDREEMTVVPLDARKLRTRAGRSSCRRPESTRSAIRSAPTR